MWKGGRVPVATKLLSCENCSSWQRQLVLCEKGRQAHLRFSFHAHLNLETTKTTFKNNFAFRVGIEHFVFKNRLNHIALDSRNVIRYNGQRENDCDRLLRLQEPDRE